MGSIIFNSIAREFIIVFWINTYNSIVIDIYFFYFRYIIIGTGHNKDITSKEKPDIVKILNDGNTTLEIAKKLNRDHRTIKKRNC